MAVDLNDLIPSLERETSVSGANIFGSEDVALGALEDAFWEGKLFGFFAAYTEAEGLVSPIQVASGELGRDWQQLIVLFAGIRAVRLTLINSNVTFRAKAGPVEFETQTSANVMSAALKQLQEKIGFLLQNLAGSISISQTFYINGLFAREDALWTGNEMFTGGSGRNARRNASWGTGGTWG